MQIERTEGACGARVYGIDLRKDQSAETIRALRAAWLAHKVLVLPDQELSFADLGRVTRYFGPVGDDPYFEPVREDSPVVAICRRADEQAPVFAEAWHTDWSFKEIPPAATLLYGVTIPPVGGNTSFIDQQAAYEAMPAELKRRCEGLLAQHSAAVAYAPDGTYGDEQSAGSDRSMRIRIDESARAVHSHPLVRTHPETGARMIYGTAGYICGFEGVDETEARELLHELYAWQLRPEFRYEHQWAPGMLVLWDNRAVLHKANAGFDGYDRLLYRTTIADDPTYYLDRSAA